MPLFQQDKKGAFRRLFLFLGLLLAAAACSAPVNQAANQADETGRASAADTVCSAAATETARVRYVHDGDTVHLEDGRKLRLIGIDAPELARRNQPAQPFALAARNYLRQLLAQHQQRVGLVWDSQAQDKYGRSLVHLVFDNGDNVQAAMLAAGLAVAYTTPPNNRFGACYRAHEAQAQRDAQQIWSHAKYRDQAVAALTDDANGFHIVHARVARMNQSDKGAWLNLEGGLAIQIKTADLDNFAPSWLGSLPGKTIRVRGWLHPRQGSAERRFYLQLRHPDNLQIL